MTKIFTLFLLYFLLYEAGNAQIGSYASVYAGCSPLTVSFTDNSGGSPSCYFWDFDINNETSTLADPSITYSSPGVYNVLHIVCYGNVKDSEYILIQVYQPPQVNFEAPDRYGCIQACHMVNFTNLTTPGQSPVAQYLWDFGDGSLAYQGDSASHCYDSISSFNVTLVARDSNGCQASLIKRNYVVIGKGPTGSLTINPTQSCNQPTITMFTGNGSSSNGPVSYNWYFDTNSYTSTLQNPTFVYYRGIYNPYLVISDTLGCMDTVYGHVVIVANNIHPNFSVSEDSITCSSLLASFTNLSTGDDLSYLWQFGNYAASNDTNPIIYFDLPGKYNVTLIATDTNNGCSSSITKDSFITVGGPTGQIVIAPDSGCAPLTIHITASVSSSTTAITAIFGVNSGYVRDSIYSLDSVFWLHTYTDAGIYSLDIYVQDSVGCFASIPTNPIIVTAICDTSAGLIGLSNQAIFQLFPNPTNNILSVSLEQDRSGSDNLIFEIYNSLGQVMLRQKISHQLSEQKIDVSELANGLYALVIKKNESIIGVSKFVKE